MNYRIFILGISFFILSSSQVGAYTNPSWVQEQSHTPYSEETNFIHRRFYFVSRLTKTINLLKKIFEYNKFSILDLSFLDEQSWHHERVSRCINAMLEDQNFRPFFQLCDEFSSYQAVDDMLFTAEFIVFIHALTKYIIANNQTFNNNEKSDLITSVIEEIRNHSSDITIGTPEVTFRIYILNRLSNTFYLLEKLEEKHLVSFLKNSKLLRENTVFSSPLIIECTQEMGESRSLQPLFALWEDLLQFKHIHNLQLIKETLYLVSRLCQDILYDKPFTSLPTVNSPFDKTNKSHFPIEALLDEIDIHTAKVAELSNLYTQEEANIPAFLPWLVVIPVSLIGAYYAMV